MTPHIRELARAFELTQSGSEDLPEWETAYDRLYTAVSEYASESGMDRELDFDMERVLEDLCCTASDELDALLGPKLTIVE